MELLPSDGGYLEAVCSYTKVIIVNSPNNPSGVVFPEIYSRWLSSVRPRVFTLIMDDIYHRLVFDGKISVPGYQFTDKDIEITKLIVVNGVSKVYGMTGFRIGWVVANRKLVEVMTNVQAR